MAFFGTNKMLMYGMRGMGAGVKCQAVAVCLDVWCGLGPKLFIDKTEKSHIGPSTCHFLEWKVLTRVTLN